MEWTAYIQSIKETAAAEADKDDDGEVDKGDSKQAKEKPKRATHSSKKKDSSSKRIEPPDDNLDEYFGLSQGQNSQETVDVTPTETPKKSKQRKQNQKMILMLPVTEERTDHPP